MRPMNNKWYLVIVVVVSLAIHLMFFGHPSQVVFDEVHFGGFVSNYYDRTYFFDIHPPLGKLLVAGFAKFFDFKPEYSFSEIGNEFPDNKYLALRFLPLLSGIVLPIIIFLLLIELGISRQGALAGGLLMALENSLLVESRLILMDPFLLTFGFTALLMYLKYRRTRALKFIILTGLFGALAISIKWTGFVFIGLPGLFELIRLFKNFSLKTVLILGLSLVILPLIIYAFIFSIHFSVLNKTGPGDAFMTPEFQKTLIGSSYYENSELRKIGFVQKFIELNTQMYTSNQTLTANHPYASKWYTWPFMSRPIYFWTDNQYSKIYLLGNPLIWWMSTVAVLILGAFLLLGQEKFNWKISFLLTGYIANLLPFIGVRRVMFIYHYLPALIFSTIILLYLIDKHKKYKILLTALVISAFAVFIYFAPLSYGTEISEEAFNRRMWLDSWR